MKVLLHLALLFAVFSACVSPMTTAKNQLKREKMAAKAKHAAEIKQKKVMNHKKKYWTFLRKRKIGKDKRNALRELMLLKLNRAREKQGLWPCQSLEDHKNGICD